MIANYSSIVTLQQLTYDFYKENVQKKQTVVGGFQVFTKLKDIQSATTCITTMFEN